VALFWDYFRRIVAIPPHDAHQKHERRILQLFTSAESTC
jgi:hypothetical protein